MIIKIVVAYFILLNTVSFLLMRHDKRRAISRGRRTPEKTLFLCALLGGSIGCLMGMSVFRHKTKHAAFTIGMPLILILQVTLAVLAYVYL